MPMKLPTGFGNVSKLPGNRRRPWRARKTSGWKMIDGRAVQQYITVGYFATRQEALRALATFNDDPHALPPTITFAEVYEKWSARKYTETSDSSVRGYKASYKLCGLLYSMPFTDIKLAHLQAVVDESDRNYPALQRLKVLLNQLFDYAVQNEIISKDRHIVEYLNIGKPQKSTKHYRFTDAELEILWSHSDDPSVQLILMLIYSGVRPGEFFALHKSRVDLTEHSFFIEKGKTDNARRKVPIHDRTFPFFAAWMKGPGDYLAHEPDGSPIPFADYHSKFKSAYWTPVLTKLGILTYLTEEGTPKEHTPDDTRHTFTTIWHEKKLDEPMRRKIQGHSAQGIGEAIYTHFDFQKLLAELNKL